MHGKPAAGIPRVKPMHRPAEGLACRRSRLQSAMEYMMTYGWAILIIAVVLGVLYSLGVFNPLTFAPRAQPGSCSVYRPSGPLTSGFISLQGACNGDIPEYTASFSGTNSFISLGDSPSLSPDNGTSGAMTFCTWYRINSATGYEGPMIKGELAPSNGNQWEFTLDQNGAPPSFTLWTPAGANIASGNAGQSLSAVVGKWMFACFTYNYSASYAFYYLNGVQHTASFASGTPASAGTGLLIVGAGEHGYSNVTMANVQLYNDSLNANDILQMYDEGIGGTPIRLQNLIGWWPLNGNANDYSGNGYNGVPTNVIYAGSWLNGYTSP